MSSSLLERGRETQRRTDRIRGLSVQPHSSACGNRRDTLHLAYRLPPCKCSRFRIRATPGTPAQQRFDNSTIAPNITSEPCPSQTAWSEGRARQARSTIRPRVPGPAAKATPCTWRSSCVPRHQGTVGVYLDWRASEDSANNHGIITCSSVSRHEGFHAIGDSPDSSLPIHCWPSADTLWHRLP